MNETKNELYGTIELLVKENTNENDTRAIELFNELILKLREERKVEGVKPTTKKRLQHKSYQKELTNLINVDVERYDLAYQTNSFVDENYKCVVSTPRASYNEIDVQVFINYQSRQIMVYTSKVNEEVKTLTNKYYSNKGYELEYTLDSKWEI